MADEPVVKQIGESYFAVWASHLVAMEFARLTDHRDTLSAELSVTNEAIGSLHWSRINLASATGRFAVIKALEEAHPGPPWRRMLDRACQRVATLLRTGEPMEYLSPVIQDEGRWFIEPWMPTGQITVLYGDGGTGKSLLALALTTAGVLGHALGPLPARTINRALYLDWETDRSTHDRRLAGLTAVREAPPDQAIGYRRLRRPLTDDLASIRADVDRHQAELVVVDSLGGACGPEPESADAAIRTLMALGALKATVLVIAHISKASAEQSRSRPYGSVYVYNLARSVIEARRDDTDDEAASGYTLSLYHRKANESRKAKPIGLHFAIDESPYVVTVCGASPDLASAGLPTQILEALRRGGKTVSTLAEELGSGVDVVRAAMNRLENRNKVVRLDSVSGGRGRKTLWGRADENRSTER
jgi:AAA domain-containing protein